MTRNQNEHRVVIEGVRPTVECGRYPGKAATGQPLQISADVFADGHDVVWALVRHGPAGPGGAEVPWQEAALLSIGNDRFAGLITPSAVGPWAFEVIGLADDYGTWARDLAARHAAGQELAVEIEEGALIVERRLLLRGLGAADRRALQRLLQVLRGNGATAVKVAAATADSARNLARRTEARRRATVAGPFPLFVDRELATFSAWYEMFPRSEGAVPPRSGTFKTASRRLPQIAEMGFDVVYLPPIHPIGETFRKGANNTVGAGPRDPGSPWAIGSRHGGHTAVHPDLGTIDDFDAFVAAARGCGLEVALDYALQCSPDHPWVREHPEWFRHRPDGSIRYAENPPKRYQDIYPLNFDTEDREGLYAACRDILLFWMDHGVRIFRVDNPHTKPLPFWEWVISEIHERDPGVIFLSEAFTRPKLMQRLAKLGFTQSYTYFTWRNWRSELIDYLQELSQTPEVDWFRPNFWVNTPDILHESLQRGGPPTFRIRAALAAITCPSWGMYAGYELYERTPLREGSEEYLHSEKYEYRPRKWDQPDTLAPFISRLNRIRRQHRDAIALLRTLRIHHVDNDALLCVSRTTDDHGDTVLLVVNLDPNRAQEGTAWLDLDALGIPDDRPYLAHDELTGASYTWGGAIQYVRLDPMVQPAHIFHLRPTSP
jgi:starch synthase (maltosyl-transferring)